MIRLTLSLDERVAEEAKRLAKQSGRSVSAMFSHFVLAMSRVEKTSPNIGPLTRKASGVVSLPKGKTEREVLQEALLEKYALDQ